MDKPKDIPILIVALFLVLAITSFVLFNVPNLSSEHPYRLLGGILFGMAAASVAARPLVVIMTSRANSLLLPDERKRIPPHVYSNAETSRMQGKFSEAVQRYTEITVNHPQELKAYVAIIEIALDNINKPDLAKQALDRGVASLTDIHARQVIRRAYDEGMALLAKKNPVNRISGAAVQG
jgi:hypothetical protein